MANDFSILLRAEIDKASKAKINSDITQISKNAEKIRIQIDTGNYEAQIERLKGQYEKWGFSAKETEEKLKDLMTAQQNLSNAKTDKNLVDAQKAYQRELQKSKNELVKLTAATASPFQTQNLSNKIEKWLGINTRASAQAKESLNSYLSTLSNPSVSLHKFKQIEQQFKNIDAAERSAGRLGKTFFGSIKEMGAKFGTWVGASRIVMSTIHGIKNMIVSVKELDTALIDLKKTTTMTSAQLEDFYYSANDTAKEMGVTTKQIIDQAAAWSRLGYSSAEAATKMAKYSSQFASISPGMDINQATDGLVSTMKAFDIGNNNPDDVLDGIMSKINIIGNTAATSNAEIVDMLTRSSSAMKEANNTLEETIALETAAVEISRNAEQVGTAYKTVAMRIRGRQTLPPYMETYMLCA